MPNIVVNSEWANGAMISRIAAVTSEVAECLTAADVENVLEPRETRRDQARVYQAVGQRVELVATPPGHHEHQKQALGRLFGQRCAEHDGHRADRFCARPG